MKLGTARKKPLFKSCRFWPDWAAENGGNRSGEKCECLFVIYHFIWSTWSRFLMLFNTLVRLGAPFNTHFVSCVSRLTVKVISSKSNGGNILIWWVQGRCKDGTATSQGFTVFILINVKLAPAINCCAWGCLIQVDPKRRDDGWEGGERDVMRSSARAEFPPRNTVRNSTDRRLFRNGWVCLFPVSSYSIQKSNNDNKVELG